MGHVEVKRVHCRQEYHDADLVAIAWPKDDELAVTVRLDLHWNGGAGSAPQHVRLFFNGVVNRPDIEAKWASLRAGPPMNLGCIDGFFTSGRIGGHTDFHLGPLDIRARSFFEP